MKLFQQHETINLLCARDRFSRWRTTYILGGGAGIAPASGGAINPQALLTALPQAGYAYPG